MSLNDAFLALLRPAVTPKPVHDGKVPTEPDGSPVDASYAVVYGSLPHKRADNLAHVSDHVTARWQVTSVGLTREQAEWVAGRCQDAVIDRSLTVDGYTTGLIEHVYGGEWIRHDDSIPGAPRFVAVDTYRLTATPTT